jgi:NTE family protein
VNCKLTYNLILSGGGIKGVAFIGALDILESNGFLFNNIAGVSAGSLIGSLLTAGYNSKSLNYMLDSFSFQKMSDIQKRISSIFEYRSYLVEMNKRHPALKDNDLITSDLRNNLISNIIKYCNDGYLFDGDYLEEWILKNLSIKGIRTFADLRGGFISNDNPNGYKMRMTAVDTTRGKLIVLPDDISFYGIKPDNLEVAKAIRMSSSVPFIFKPVELKSSFKNSINNYQIIDGGVFDNFPFWLINYNTYDKFKYSDIPSIGMKLVSNEQKNFLSGFSFVNILKSIISANHNIDVPCKGSFPNKDTIEIYTSNISALDFNVNYKEKEYLINSGRIAASNYINLNKS